jgi:hypothetical protein
VSRGEEREHAAQMTLAVRALFRLPDDEASRRAGCREIRTSISMSGMRNGALPHGPSCRAHLDSDARAMSAIEGNMLQNSEIAGRSIFRRTGNGQTRSHARCNHSLEDMPQENAIEHRPYSAGCISLL